MEKVQLSLERFLPELQDLEDKGLFTSQELADITQRRRTLETALVRKNVQVHDYSNYIQYELNLEKLRRLRMSKALSDKKRRKKVAKHSLSDHSIISHVTALYRSALRRFQDNTALWQRYIDFVLVYKSQAAGAASRAMTSALSVHPRHAPFWIQAIRFESEGISGLSISKSVKFDENAHAASGGNPEGARRLCMRALRFLRGTSFESPLWLEWLRLELVAVERQRRRAQVLGIDFDAGIENGQIDGSRNDLPDGAHTSNGAQSDAFLRDDPQRDSERDSARNSESDSERDSERNSESESESESDPDSETPSEDGSNSESASSDPDDAQIDAAEKDIAQRPKHVITIVLDYAAESQNHSPTFYAILLDYIRHAPTPLRTSVLAHIYKSIKTASESSTSQDAAKDILLLATRGVYDTEFKEDPDASLSDGWLGADETNSDTSSWDIPPNALLGPQFDEAVARFELVLGAPKRPVASRAQPTTAAQLRQCEVWQVYFTWVVTCIGKAINTRQDGALTESTLNWVARTVSLVKGAWAKCAFMSPQLAIMMMNFFAGIHDTSALREIWVTASLLYASFDRLRKSHPELDVHETNTFLEDIWFSYLDCELKSGSTRSDAVLNKLFRESFAAVPWSPRPWNLYLVHTYMAQSHDVNALTRVLNDAFRYILTHAPDSFDFDDQRSHIPPWKVLIRTWERLAADAPAQDKAAAVRSIVKENSLLPIGALQMLATLLIESQASQADWRPLLEKTVTGRHSLHAEPWLYYAEALLHSGLPKDASQLATRAQRYIAPAERRLFDIRWASILG